MSVVEIIAKLFGVGGDSVQHKVYDRADCDLTFEFAKQPERASCPECLSKDVTKVGTADR